MKKTKYNVAVVGATGAVGNEMVSILQERRLPGQSTETACLHPGAGTKMEFKGKEYTVEVMTENSFAGMDIGLFSPGGSVSEKFAPIAGKAGCVVIDNTSAFRMDPQVPLVVPEVNAHAIARYSNKNIIANPNCSTIQMVVALKPIHDVARIKRVVVSTYQAVSGTGKRAIKELEDQVLAIYGNREIDESGLSPSDRVQLPSPHRCLLRERLYQRRNEDGQRNEEDHGGRFDPGHGNHRQGPGFLRPFRIGQYRNREERSQPDQVREILSKAPGVKVVDDPKKFEYPLAIHAAGKDETFVGRIREDESIPNGINMWVVADNIRKGAALNAVQIAEVLIQKYL